MRQRVGWSHHEAAAIIRFWVTDPRNPLVRGAQYPVTSSPQFIQLIEPMLPNSQRSGEWKNLVFKHRHPWAVIGGIWNYRNRGSDVFTGFLQVCLEEGGF